VVSGVKTASGSLQENLSALQLIASLKVLGPQNVGKSRLALQFNYSKKSIL
jgi:hypothetical protein